MANAIWPATLPQQPEQDGYSRILRPAVISSNMTYGPPKIRRMVTDYLYDVELGLWVDFDQNKTLEDFYIANMALPFDWKDFGILPNPDATYTFKAPPSPAPLGGLHWVVRLSLTMETYG